jgi:CubicO group peptidase (beta-lactamase class C family)
MLGGPNADVPAVIGPAGVVHLSILDFAAWAAWNAAEGRRGPALLRPETVRLLQTARIATPTRPDAAPGTPDRGGYGLGWGVIEQPYAREPIVTHTGSNTMNLAMAMLQPRQDFGLVLATNCAGAPDNAALNAAAAALYARFGPAPRRVSRAGRPGRSPAGSGPCRPAAGGRSAVTDPRPSPSTG